MTIFLEWHYPECLLRSPDTFMAITYVLLRQGNSRGTTSTVYWERAVYWSHSSDLWGQCFRQLCLDSRGNFMLYVGAHRALPMSSEQLNREGQGVQPAL